jgi:hypothetical protein
MINDAVLANARPDSWSQRLAALKRVRVQASSGLNPKF